MKQAVSPLARDGLRAVLRRPFLVMSRVWFWLGCLLAALVVYAIEILAPQVTGTLAVGAIAPNEGLAYVAVISEKPPWPYVLHGARVGSEASGPLLLFEGGHQLGPGDSAHSVIGSSGGGRYSHWGEQVYFSSSDGSDPRINGRSYTFSAETALDPALRRVGAVLLILAFIGLTVEPRGSVPFRRTWTCLGKALMAIGFGALTALSWIAVQADPLHSILDSSDIRRGPGAAYVATVDLRVLQWPLRISSADPKLTVTENGRQIGRFQSEASQLGNEPGQYALYEDQLYFSAADGSDSRKNGRIYAWMIPVRVDLTAWILAGAVTLLGLLLGYRSISPAVFNWITAPPGVSLPSSRGRQVRFIGFLGVFALLAVYVVLYRWGDGPSGHLGFKGYLPVSDALGYYLCAVVLSGVELTAIRDLPFDWCARKIIYPAMLGAFFRLTHWQPAIVLLIQAAIVGCAIAVCTWVAAHVYSRLAASIIMIGSIAFAYQLAVGNFMTEAVGLPLGLLGLALLLCYAGGTRCLLWLYSGLALISIAMFARMGALLMLPMLALWSCAMIFVTRQHRRLVLCVGASISCAAGPIMQMLLSIIAGIDGTNTGGNYASVLYGLSTGSRDWRQAYSDFAPHFQSSTEAAVFAKMYTVSLANIRENPSTFLQSLWRNFEVHAWTLFPFMERFNTALSVLLLSGLVWCVMRVRHAPASLLLALFVGELISIPFIYTNVHDHRILAVSMGGRLLLAGVGLWWPVATVRALLGSATNGVDRDQRGTVHYAARVAFGTGSIVIIMAFLALTPVLALPAVNGRGCAEGQNEVVVRLGRESMGLQVGSRANPLQHPVLGVTIGQIFSDSATRDALWWAKSLSELKEGSVLIYGIQLMPQSLGEFIPLLYEGALPSDSANPVSFCYDPKPTDVVLADAHLRRAITAHPVTGRD